MCYGSLAVKGVKKILPTKREKRTKLAAPKRDEMAVARKKANRHKEAQRRTNKDKRERRKRAKMHRQGEILMKGVGDIRAPLVL